MDTYLKEQIRQIGHTGDFTIESLLVSCGNCFSRLERRNDAWSCIGIEEINHTEKIGHGITPLESVARFYISVFGYYKEVNSNK